MRIAGIVLIILQVISLMPSIASGEDLFANGFVWLIGRFLMGIVGVILLIVAYNREQK